MADDLGSAAGMIAGKAVEGNLLDKINQMENRIAALEGANTVMADVGEITDDLGDVRAGRILALTTGYEPTDSDATGVVIDAAGIVWGDDIVNIIGLNEGVMMFCMSALDGKLKAAGGALTIDDDGITMLGLRYGIKQIATADGATRYGMMEMFVPSGDTKPAFGLTYSDNAGEDVMVNGTFETGDLTGWTQSATSFSVVDKGDGTYCAECAAITGADETLTSDRIAVSAGDKLQIGWKTKDSLTETTATLQASEDTYLAEDAATTNYGSEATMKVRTTTAGSRRAPLMRFDFSSLPTGVTSKPSFNCDGLRAYASAITKSTFGGYYFNVRIVKRNWVEAQATWNLFATGSAWGTAGCLNSSTDCTINSTNSGTEIIDGWNTLTLNQASVKNYIDNPTTYYGLVWYLSGSGTAAELEFDVDSSEGTNPPELLLSWQEPSVYTVSVKWYDDASAGSLLRTDVIGTTDNLTEWTNHTATVDSPTGALSAQIVITASAGEAFWLDDFTVYVLNVVQRMYADDNGWKVNNGLQIGTAITLTETTAPDSPSAGYRAVYAKSDGVYQKVSAGTESRLALASEIPTLTYPDYWLGNGALLQMYDSSNNRKALTVTVINANTYGGMAGYSAAAVAANGDYYLLTIPLRAGTYSFNANYTKNTDYGKFDLYVGATKVSGATPLDCYASSVSNNNEWAITGIKIAADGWHTFKILNVGKNTKSADYRLWMGAIAIYRTA